MIFSIIIPTMWRSDKIIKMLPEYEKSPYVGEVIIIDNDPDKTPDLTEFSKVKRVTRGVNIYVNPAWNWGAQLAKYDLIFANDDVYIYDLDEVLCGISWYYDYDIIGMSYVPSDTFKIEHVDKFPANGFGTFFYVKNYTHIPEIYKIWRGDYILFCNSEKRAVMKGVKGEFEFSRTVNEFKDIASKDLATYREINNTNRLYDKD